MYLESLSLGFGISILKAQNKNNIAWLVGAKVTRASGGGGCKAQATQGVDPVSPFDGSYTGKTRP